MPSALEIDGPIASITLDGPLDAERVAELSGFCDHIAEDDSVRVCTLMGAPETWAGWSQDALAAAEELGLIGDPFAAVATLPQVTIAVLDAEIRDAGLELALCADLRLAASAATLGMPNAGQSLPIAGGLQRLSRAVGRVHALELVLTGDAMDAATAKSWGLVSEVSDDARGEARNVAARLAQRGPIATRFAKEAVRRGLEMPLDQALRYETDLTVLLQTTEDRAEGVQAFVEKRAPNFEGR
ncbi:MAG TPA: enoyl-CoA hydratase/isomerase family protein [Dehalococcoidia bacterium]|nr:enoyl-CoA hydratase/isomerase family protein [Dehalococcoidia bacterium]